jgi:hypothetical protein
MTILFPLIAFYGFFAGLWSSRTRTFTIWAMVISVAIAGLGLLVMVISPNSGSGAGQAWVGVMMSLGAFCLASLVCFVLGVIGIIQFARRNVRPAPLITEPRLLNSMDGEIRML